MDIKLIRKVFTDESTIGEMDLPNGFKLYTLEDMVREPGVKVKGKTAIPYGRYEVVYSWSDRFQRKLPLLLNVPMFTGIRIHAGNTSADTEGCILVGLNREENRITESRVALSRLLSELVPIMEKEKVGLEIVSA